MKIAVVASESPFSLSPWSGIPYYAVRELTRRYGDVVGVETPKVDALVKKMVQLRRIGMFPAREPIVTTAYAEILTRKIENIKPDLIVSLGAAHKVAKLPPQSPIVLVEDATFATIVDYYPRYRHLSSRTRRIGDALQLQVMRRARAILVPSSWAADEGARYYGLPAERFTIAPLGANLASWPARPPVRSNDGPLRLLFVGYEWARKGGPMVLETFRRLRSRLPEAELHIAGCSPTATRGEPGVVHHGLLDKLSPEHMARFEQVFGRASLFFMPSQSEAFGLVYCEACAFGLPIVARDTGGVGAIVQDGRNGRLLGPTATAEDYLDAILGIWSDQRRYAAMQQGARRAFERRLNWEAWGDAFHAAVFGAASRPDVHPSLSVVGEPVT